MGKLHIGEISELSNKVCKLDEQVQTLQERTDSNNGLIEAHRERLDGTDKTLEEHKKTLNDFGGRIVELEGEKFFLITEDEFDALTPEQKAEKNYAVIEE